MLYKFIDYMKKARTRQSKGFEWYDGALEDQDDQDERMYPLYQIGEELNLYNPFMGAYLVDYETEIPEQYTVVAVQYDEESYVYRYKLRGFSDTDWVSEEWLTRPVVSSFKRALTPSVDVNMRELERIYEIDRLLDVMNHGTDEEKVEAERRLKELTE